MASHTNEQIYRQVLSRELLDPSEFEALAEAYFDVAMMDDEEAAKVAEAKLPLLVPPAMPTFKYTLSDVERWALVAYVRTLHKNNAPAIKVSDNAETSRPSFPVREAPAWDMSEDDRKALVDGGEVLFKEKYNCIGCHIYTTSEGSEIGGLVGPDLRRSGDRLNRDWTYQWISNPQGMKPNTKMPNLGLTEEDAKAITLYLTTLEPQAA